MNSVADKYNILTTEKIPQVFEAGKESEYIEFWNKFTGNGTRTDYRFGFAGIGWSNNTFNPPMTISPSGARYMFQWSAITSLNAEVDEDGNRQIQVDFTNTGEMRDTFSDCESLTTIYMTVQGNKNFNLGTFKCSNLTTLIFLEGSEIQNSTINLQYCTGLSKDSFKSIINSLSNTATGQSITFSKSAVNNAFEINVDDESTYPDGSEYYELRHSRDNWTINYI